MKEKVDKILKKITEEEANFMLEYGAMCQVEVLINEISEVTLIKSLQELIQLRLNK